MTAVEERHFGERPHGLDTVLPEIMIIFYRCIGISIGPRSEHWFLSELDGEVKETSVDLVTSSSISQAVPVK